MTDSRVYTHSPNEQQLLSPTKEKETMIRSTEISSTVVYTGDQTPYIVHNILSQDSHVDNVGSTTILTRKSSTGVVGKRYFTQGTTTHLTV